jgi:hypothetical protein
MRFRCSSVAIRRNMRCPRALWKVMNGRASAPPAAVCTGKPHVPCGSTIRGLGSSGGPVWYKVQDCTDALNTRQVMLYSAATLAELHYTFDTLDVRRTGTSVLALQPYLDAFDLRLQVTLPKRIPGQIRFLGTSMLLAGCREGGGQNEGVGLAAAGQKSLFSLHCFRHAATQLQQRGWRNQGHAIGQWTAAGA